MHTQFSADLERTREQVVVAQERASAIERRALREIDQERTLRQEAEQAVADLRTELVAMQARAQDAAVAATEARVRLQAERDTLSQQLAAAEQALGRGLAEQEGLRAELEAALRQAERAQAEATASRRLATTRRQVPAAKTKLKFKAGSA
ncbi:hypothetical protein [Cupriavidus sp. PET2-C1]